MNALLTLTGTIDDIGHLDHDKTGFVLRTPQGQRVEVTGLSIEQLRGIKGLAFDGKTIIQIGEALA